MEFYKKLELLCTEKKTKPQPLCISLGITSGTVTGWKKGAKPKVENLITIADYFNVSTDWLLDRTDNRYSHKLTLKYTGENILANATVTHQPMQNSTEHKNL